MHGLPLEGNEKPVGDGSPVLVVISVHSTMGRSTTWRGPRWHEKIRDHFETFWVNKLRGQTVEGFAMFVLVFLVFLLFFLMVNSGIVLCTVQYHSTLQS